MNSTHTNLIQPAAVQRDEFGNWYHPDIPVFYGSDESTDESPKWEDWLKTQGLEQSKCMLEWEDESHPVYQSYFEADDPDPNFAAWGPEPPKGEGWFVLAICDTEDGPCAWFVRRKDSNE